LSHFARRYFGNRYCFLLLRVLRCFSSPRSPLPPMDSVAGIHPLWQMGCPIQKSPGQCLFSGSPKLIAACHVFHRHPAPRHPPFSLNSLAIKMPLYYLFFFKSRRVCRCHSLYSVFKEQQGILPRAQGSKPKAESPSQPYGTSNSELSALNPSMVEVNGIEPMTSCVQSRRSPN
jgi:hypothetical protein